LCSSFAQHSRQDFLSLDSQTPQSMCRRRGFFFSQQIAQEMPCTSLEAFAATVAGIYGENGGGFILRHGGHLVLAI